MAAAFYLPQPEAASEVGALRFCQATVRVAEGVRQAAGPCHPYDGYMSYSTAPEAEATMLTFHGCPRCKGTVIASTARADEDPMCVNCGWRRPNIPADVQEYVDEHLGQPQLRERYERTYIDTGKPPLSGWQRLKRRRQTRTA